MHQKIEPRARNGKRLKTTYFRKNTNTFPRLIMQPGLRVGSVEMGGKPWGKERKRALER